MAHLGAVHQWELFAADLNPAVGREQSGERRPVLIVSNDGFNRAFDVVTVLPLTKEGGKKRKIFPFEVRLPANTAGNDLDSIIMPQQIRTISKSRLLEPLGALTDAALRTEIEDRILDHLGISLEAEE
ncbi:MAG: type II toxin-antitoxin system PemK/MazF family toxin [Chthoniobacterales bacterium]